MRYRFCDMDGHLLNEGVYGAGCYNHVHVSGKYFRLMIIIDAETIKKEIDTILTASCESRKLKAMSEGIPEGEAKEARMKILDLWASLVQDPMFKDNLDKMLTDAHTECEEVLYSIQFRGVHDHNSIDNTPHKKQEWVMELKMPAIMSSNSSWSIMRAVQEYMKNKVISEWSQNMLSEAAVEYASRADQQIGILKSICRHRNAGSLERSYGLL